MARKGFSAWCQFSCTAFTALHKQKIKIEESQQLNWPFILTGGVCICFRHRRKVQSHPSQC